MRRLRPKSLILVCALATIFPWLSSAAHAEDLGDAQEAGAREERSVEMAVLDVRVTGDVDPRRVEGISSLLAAEASRRPGVEVRSSADIRAVLGFEAERQLLSCEDDGACMAELAGALGVDFILTSEVTRIGETFVVTLNLLDSASGRAHSRASQRVQREADLIGAADQALNEVLAGFSPLEEAQAWKQPSPRQSRLALGMGSVGAGLGVGGGILLLTAWQTYWASEGEDGGTVTMAQIDSARRVRAPLGVGFMAGGAALVGAAFLMPRMAGSGPTASLTMLDDGAMASIAFSLR